MSKKRNTFGKKLFKPLMAEPEADKKCTEAIGPIIHVLHCVRDGIKIARKLLGNDINKNIVLQCVTEMTSSWLIHGNSMIGFQI